MGRRRRHGRRGFKIPVISLGILGMQALAANAGGGDSFQKVSRFVSFYTGLDVAVSSTSFQPQDLLIGYAPWLVKRFLLPIARPRIAGVGLPVSLS